MLVKIIKNTLIMSVWLLAVPAFADHCPAPSQIEYDGSKFIAQTDSGTWTSAPTENIDDSNITFWHAKGGYIKSKKGYQRVTKALMCIYFDNMGTSAIFLQSPGYPKQRYTLANMNWDKYDDPMEVGYTYECIGGDYDQCVFNMK